MKIPAGSSNDFRSHNQTFVNNLDDVIPMKKKILLGIGGYINIVIGFRHIVGLFWADYLFEITRIGRDMAELSRIHIPLPYLVTLVVACVFFVFGLYGLSAADKIKKLPFLNPGIFVIAFGSWSWRTSF